MGALMAASIVQGLWEAGELVGGDMLRMAPEREPDIGAGFMALLMTIRVDPHLPQMSAEEFTELAMRICEPLYEIYFEQRMRSER